MNVAEFKESVTAAKPPDALSGPLRALWYEAKGEWDTAHEILQDESGPAGSWVHAYLHRVEGDESNAGHWYQRADRPHCKTPLAEEWEAISTQLLQA